MCFVDVGKVQILLKDKAQLSDGRIVRLGNLKKIKIGDLLEVYADLAVNKVESIKPKTQTVPDRNYQYK